MKGRLLNLEYPDNPYLSLATEEAIFMEVMRKRSFPTLRFYTHRNAVVLGCFQVASEEVDMDYAEEKEIAIVKRFTGGGAVYHDSGNLNFSIIANDSYGIGINVAKLYSMAMDVPMNAFRSLGMNPEKGRLNDISINGKKILGSAATIRQNAFLFHAAVLVDTNLMTLASVLKVPGVKLKDKGISTVLERVTNIRIVSGKGMEEVKAALISSCSNLLGMEFEAGELTSGEESLATKLYEDKYTKREWNLERSIINVHY